MMTPFSSSKYFRNTFFFQANFVGQKKGGKQIPGGKEEVYATSALELVNVSSIIFS